MSENKKYFYLKLKDSFFSSEEMLMLESVPDGLIYQNIYLRLCLLSLKKEGALTFKDMIPYDVQMLSTVLHIDLAKMKLAVELFERLGLVTKTDNETLYMTDIQALIGQSSTEAERIAKYRKRIADSNNGTQALADGECTKSVQMLQSCTPEIEIELKTKTKQEQEKKQENCVCSDSFSENETNATGFENYNWGDLQQELWSLLKDHNENSCHRKIILDSKSDISFYQKECRQLIENWRAENPYKIRMAFFNFLDVIDMDDKTWWKANTFNTFIKNYRRFDEDNFNANDFLENKGGKS